MYSITRPTDKVIAVVGEVVAEILDLHEIKGNLRERLGSRVGVVARLDLRLVVQSHLVLMLRRVELLVCRSTEIQVSKITKVTGMNL